MKQLKELKLSDTILTAAEVAQKISDCIAPFGVCVSTDLVCAGVVCAGISYANAYYVNDAGHIILGQSRDGAVKHPLMSINSQQINTSGLGGRGVFSFNSHDGDSSVQVARMGEVNAAIEEALAGINLCQSPATGVSYDEFRGLESKVAKKAEKCHTHANEDLVGLTDVLTGKASVARVESIENAMKDLADDDCVVHASGDEVVAGVKTFSSGVNINGKTLIEPNVDTGELVFSGVEGGGAQVSLTRVTSNIVMRAKNNGTVHTTWTFPGGNGGTVATRRYVTDALACSLAGYYTKEEVDEKVAGVEVDLSGYYTKKEVDDMIVDGLPLHTHSTEEIEWGANDNVRIDMTSSLGSEISSSIFIGGGSAYGAESGTTVSGIISVGRGTVAYTTCGCDRDVLRDSCYWDTGASSCPTCPSWYGGDVIVGASAKAAAGGVAVGESTDAGMYGVAVGAFASAVGGGVAIGADARAMRQQILIGCTPEAYIACCHSIVLSARSHYGDRAASQDKYTPFSVTFDDVQGIGIHFLLGTGAKCSITLSLCTLQHLSALG